MATAQRSSATTRSESYLWLRRFLGLDAVVTGANGIAYVAASGPLGRWFGVGSSMLLGIGVFLVLFGAGVGYLACQSRPATAGVNVVIEANVLWTVASIVALLFLFEDPSTVGTVWIPLQAATVGGFAVLQFVTLRRARAASA